MIFNSLQKKTWPPVAYERGAPTPKALGGLGFRCKLLKFLPINYYETESERSSSEQLRPSVLL